MGGTKANSAFSSALVSFVFSSSLINVHWIPFLFHLYSDVTMGLMYWNNAHEYQNQHGIDVWSLCLIINSN